MPVLLTEAYASKQFFIPLTADKSEGVWCRPLTETKRREIRDAAVQEAGHDQELATAYAVRDTLKTCLTGWRGFRDAGGEELPFSPEMVAECCRFDPDFMSGLFLRVGAVARFGELADLRD